MEVLAVIPARGGSRGLPGKNLAELAGRPLLAYTADCVGDCRRPVRAVLSTDDEAVARLGRRLGLEAPFRRPAELAADDTPTLPVIQHALAELSAAEGYRPEVVAVLQPTSPLRNAAHLEAALELFSSVDCDSLISLAPVEHTRPGPGASSTALPYPKTPIHPGAVRTCHRSTGPTAPSI